MWGGRSGFQFRSLAASRACHPTEGCAGFRGFGDDHALRRSICCRSAMIRATGHVQVFVCIQPTGMRSVLPESLPEGLDAHVAQNHDPALISPQIGALNDEKCHRLTPSGETDRREFAPSRSTLRSHRLMSRTMWRQSRKHVQVDNKQ